MQRIQRIFIGLLIVGLLTAPTTVGAHGTHEWMLSGVVFQMFEIPNTGGQFALGLFRINSDGTEEYLDLFCDKEQPITQWCMLLGVGDVIEVAGVIRSNEPNSGQRLSVRRITPIS